MAYLGFTQPVDTVLHCLGGWETLCESQENSGYSVNGSFAEYVLADADYVGIIPDGVDSVEIAPVLCAGVTVYKGLKMTDTKSGDWVVISGIGGLGHMAVQYAIAMGLNVAAVDVIDDEKLAFDKKLGAGMVQSIRKTLTLVSIYNKRLVARTAH